MRLRHRGQPRLHLHTPRPRRANRAVPGGGCGKRRSWGCWAKTSWVRGSDFDVEVALTGDSYVAGGEESALMEAIEGKRAMPRFRPPFPAQFGLFGKAHQHQQTSRRFPTCRRSCRKGGEWFAGIGHESAAPGTAILCLLRGAATTPGMMEVPAGHQLEGCAVRCGRRHPRTAKKLKFLQTGGPLGGVLGADNVDVVLDFDILRNCGGHPRPPGAS